MSAARPRRIGRSLLGALAVAAISLTLAPPAAADDVPSGSTVVGTVVRAYVEHQNEQDAGARTDFGAPLTFVKSASGDQVRVPTEALRDVPLGATVSVTVGGDVQDAPAKTDQLDPAKQVLSASVVAPASPAATTPAVTDTVSIAMVAPVGTVQDSTTLATVVNQVAGPVTQFWAAQSNGAIQLAVGDTHDWGTTTAHEDCSDPEALWSDIAQQIGFTPGPGKHLMLYLPRNTAACAYGLAEVGGSLHAGGYLYVQDTLTSVIAHELGHNFGLLHSGSQECNGSLETAPCDVQEYGDLYDVMGASWDQVGSLNAAQAARIGVLPAAQVQSIAASDPGGTVTLAPLSGTAGVRAVRLTGTGGQVYYLEYRSPAGQDVYLGQGPTTNWEGLRPGVLLHRVETASSADSSTLLDGSPTSGSGYAYDMDDVLPVGVSVPVSGGAIQVTVQSTDGSGAQVRIDANPGAGLAAGAQISTGEEMETPVKHYRSGLTAAGDLTVSAPDGRVYWSAGAYAPGGRLVMQGDGNLVIYTRGGAPAWNSGTSGAAGAHLALQDDGNLVIYRGDGVPVWWTGTYRPDTMGTNLGLAVGQQLASLDGHYHAVFQGDGNFVVYGPGSRVVWASMAFARNARVVLQGDGNVVAYSGAGAPIWASGTRGAGGTVLVMQGDGNLVLYRANGTPVWCTGADIWR